MHREAAWSAMSTTTLALAAVGDVAIAALLAWTALRARRHGLSQPSARANRAYVVWWAALAAQFALNAAWDLAAATGVHDAPDVLPVLVATDYLFVLAAVAAAWGILAYLLYLSTGRERLHTPLAAFYTLYAALALVALWLIQPTGLNVATWFVGWDYAAFDRAGTLYALVVAFLLLPQLGAAVAYALLARRIDDAERKRSVRQVSAGIIAILALPILGEVLRLGRFEAWQAGLRFAILLAAVLVLRATRERAAPVAPPAPPGPTREERDEGFRRRIAALV